MRLDVNNCQPLSSLLRFAAKEVLRFLLLLRSEGSEASKRALRSEASLLLKKKNKKKNIVTVFIICLVFNSSKLFKASLRRASKRALRSEASKSLNFE